MIQYNPKEWFKLIFYFHKTDTFRVLLPIMFWLALFSGAIAYIELDFFHGDLKSTTIVHSLLGLVISLLLVFRTNTAYERWWEGRKLWGSLLNNSRNLALKLAAFLPETAGDEKKKLAILITNYSIALRDHLRNEASPENLVQHDFGEYKDSQHLPNSIAAEIMVEVNHVRNKGLLSGEQFLMLNPELISFTDICGGCERIRKTPIPYSYSIFLKKFIFIYIVTLPFGLVSDLRYWMIPVVILMFYVLASLELIAEEIEDPFGKDANDLPTDEICTSIQKNMTEILL